MDITLNSARFFVNVLQVKNTKAAKRGNEMKKAMDEELDDYYEECAERINEIVVEIIELDGDEFEPNDKLIQQVQGIDFKEPDAFNALGRYIEQFSLQAIKTIHPECMIRIEHVDKDLNPIGIESHPPEHEDIELWQIEPWGSSALRKLWKAITSHEFKDIWRDADGLPTVIDMLEILLLSLDEDGYVPVVTDDRGNVIGGSVAG